LPASSTPHTVCFMTYYALERCAGWTMPEHKGDAANPVPTPTAFRSLRVLDLSEPNDVYAPTTSKLTDSIVLRIAVRCFTLDALTLP
jgi:hypothetical protein